MIPTKGASLINFFIHRKSEMKLILDYLHLNLILKLKNVLLDFERLI